MCGNSYGRYENRSDTEDCLAEDCVDGKGICGGSLKNAVYDLRAVPGWEPACLPGTYINPVNCDVMLIFCSKVVTRNGNFVLISDKLKSALSVYTARNYWE